MRPSALFEGPLTPIEAIIWLWIGWGVSWMLAAIWARRTIARPQGLTEMPGRLTVMLGGILVFTHLIQFGPTWSVSDTFGWAMAGVVLAGILFAWWARVHLGSLWSGTVTRKENHRIVDTGPYALVRHPIYTGVLTSIVATSVARGRLDALIGAALCAIGLAMIARLEENFLSVDLGAEYADYKQRVRMLVPYLF